MSQDDYQENTSNFYDKMCLDSMDESKPNVIKWFILNEYAKSKGERLLSEFIENRVHSTLKVRWNEVLEEYKEFVQLDSDFNLKVIGYPKTIEIAYNNVRNSFKNSS